MGSGRERCCCLAAVTLRERPEPLSHAPQLPGAFVQGAGAGRFLLVGRGHEPGLPNRLSRSGQIVGPPCPVLFWWPERRLPHAVPTFFSPWPSFALLLPQRRAARLSHATPSAVAAASAAAAAAAVALPPPPPARLRRQDQTSLRTMHSLWPFPCQLRQQPPPGSPLLPMPAGPPPAAAASLPFAAHPHPRFCFSPPLQTTMTPASSFPRKRARPLADIEGVDEDLRVCSKKRRLRLTLVTSRLSDPYSVPSTNIMDRGNCSRVAIWAKTRMVARNVLRKAAILNKIKRDAMAAREAQERQVEIARQQFRSVFFFLSFPACRSLPCSHLVPGNAWLLSRPSPRPGEAATSSSIRR